MSIQFITHPQDKFRIGDFLRESFAETQWTDFRAAVAFIKVSGTKYITNSLSEFVSRGSSATITAGIDVGGTTVEGLESLLDGLSNKGDLFIFHNAGNYTFHPKIYLFRNATHAKVAIGSTNLTEGGLFTNYEAGVQLLLDLQKEGDAALLLNIENSLRQWSTPQEGLCYKVTPDIIKQLILENRLPTEAVIKAQKKRDREVRRADKVQSIFKGRGVPPAPKPPIMEPDITSTSPEDDEAIRLDDEDAQSLTVEEPLPVMPQPGKFSVFLMTLQKTDVGVGQTTRGTQRRSPEIFIPLICRDYDPEFWGWPYAFVPDPNWTGSTDQNGFGKMDRTNVMIRMAGTTFPASIWYNPDKRDVRIRSESIRSAGMIGDIFYLERADGLAGFSYYAEIIPLGSLRYQEYLHMCTKGVRNSKKLWNYI